MSSLVNPQWEPEHRAEVRNLPFQDYRPSGRENNMELGSWLGLAIIVIMCVALIAWIVYEMKKGKKDEE